MPKNKGKVRIPDPNRTCADFAERSPNDQTQMLTGALCRVVRIGVEERTRTTMRNEN